MSIVLVGSTSGSVTLQEPAVAGTTVLDLPATSGTVVVSGTTPTLNGITFPATQVPSADANTLDDYEEGTWTPTFTSSGASFTYSEQYGSYVKVGSLVTAQFRIRGSTATGTTSNAVQVTGFPFTSANLGSLSSNAGAIALNTFPTVVFPELTPNSTLMNLWISNTPAITTAASTVGAYLICTVSYRAA